MNRIFPTLALFGLTFVAVSIVLGLTVDTSDFTDQAARDWKRVHMIAGILASLAVMLVNGIVITYFVGTSRWCREVVETYRLDIQLLVRSAALKRKAFPITLAAMLLVVGMVALGGAADTARALPPAPLGLAWSDVHLIGSLVGAAILVWISYLQWIAIALNQQVIADILAKVREVRLAKGLDVEEPRFEDEAA